MTFDQWRSEIGRYFGFGRTYSTMLASQQADVDAVIDRGLRQFFAPPILQDGSAHVWSFMRPTMSIVVHAPYSDGALTDVTYTPTATASFTGTNLPIWIVNGSLLYKHPINGEEIQIHIYRRTGNTSMEIEDAVASDTFITIPAGIPYTITDGIHNLPTSFGGIDGDATLEAASGMMPIRQVSEERIREMFLNTAIQTGTPAYFCVRPWRNPTVDHTGNRAHTGQYTRYEMVFFPRPDKVYNISFRYLFVFPGLADYVADLGAVDSTVPGMAYHHETMLASCLAVAEQFADSPNGEHREYFAKRIAASVALDRRMGGGAFMGRNIDRSDTLYSQGRAPLNTQITYNNVLY